MELNQISSHQGYILPLYIKTFNDIILVGDLLRSITVLRFDPITKQLIELARDYAANTMRSIAILGNENEYFLGTDDTGNIFVLKRHLDAETVEEMSKLHLFGEYHIGELINTIKAGSIVSQDDILIDNQSTASTMIHPITGTPITSYSYLFGCISGMIGTILLLNEEKYQYFAAIEKSVKISSSLK
jgi:DNA damage-binding protein 1